MSTSEGVLLIRSGGVYDWASGLDRLDDGAEVLCARNGRPSPVALNLQDLPDVVCGILGPGSYLETWSREMKKTHGVDPNLGFVPRSDLKKYPR
jgi:hypothetical protein